MTRVGFGACVFMGAHAFAGGEAQGGLMIGGVRVSFERRVAARFGCIVAGVEPACRHELPIIEARLAVNATTDASPDTSAGEARR